MKFSKRSLITFKYLPLITTLGYVIYLYADVFLYPNVNDGYSLFALVLFVPYPLLLAIVLGRFIRSEHIGKNQQIVFNLFPVMCLVLTISQFLLLSLDHHLNLICIVMSILLFCFSIFLYSYEFKITRNT